ncbi:MAG: glycosyltransferase family 4 protein [Pseudomonadota bacterium]|nr:glycosyltransferase family 4 protein [Pseudomonadota bacterium]
MNRLLALCTSPDQGGLELYFIKFIKYYDDKKSVYVACAKDSYISENITKKKIECESNGILKSIRNFIRLRRSIIKNEIDWIHVSWTNDLLLGVLLKIFSPRHIKLIFYRQMKLTRFKNSPYHKFIYGKIDLFLVITKKLYNEACKYLPIKKSIIHVLSYGISKPDYKFSMSRKAFFDKYNMEASIFSIGVFSRIEEQKGQHLLIEAIRQSKHKIQLFIVGHCMDEKYKNQLENISSEYNLSSHICFTGFLQSPMNYMPFFNLVVLPTYEETFGLVVAEAMLMKVPVLGSNAGGVPEIITHESNGLLFETRNYNDLQDKIDMVIENSQLRERIIDKGFKFVNKYYEYYSHFDKFEKIINTY